MKNDFAIEIADAEGFLVCRRSSTNWWEAGKTTAVRLLKRHADASIARISGRTNGKFYCREYYKAADGTITTERKA